MADDERRAEIEAVYVEMYGEPGECGMDDDLREHLEQIAAALDHVRDVRGDDDLRRWLLRTVGSASTVGSAKRVVERLVADALARVRDARGDEEAGRWVQPQAFCEQPTCQAKNDGSCHVPENCGHFQPKERWVSARSPQGEDHEAGEPWAERVSAIVDQAHAEDWGGKHRAGFCEACAAAYIVAQHAVPGAPSRDGTVSAPKADENQEASQNDERRR